MGSSAGGSLGSSSWMSSGKPRRKKTNPGSLELSLSPLPTLLPLLGLIFPLFLPLPTVCGMCCGAALMDVDAVVYLGTSGNVRRILEHLLTFSSDSPAGLGLQKSRRGEMLSMLTEERETNRFLLLNLASNIRFKNKLPGNLLVWGFILKVCAASSLPAPLSQHCWHTGKNSRCSN